MGCFLGFGAVVCSWAMLRAIGSERQKRLREIENAPDAAASTPNPPHPPKT